MRFINPVDHFLGGLAMAVLGPLATLPLVGRVLFPSAIARLRRAVGRMVAPPSETELTLERAGGEPGQEDSALGFTLEEMVDSVERMLRDTGLTFNWSRLVIVCGHGSSSLNNPHESAYNCGASRPCSVSSCTKHSPRCAPRWWLPWGSVPSWASPFCVDGHRSLKVRSAGMCPTE